MPNIFPAKLKKSSYFIMHIIPIPFTRILLTGFAFLPLYAAEYHVSPQGNDSHAGTKEAPFQTIAAAAQKAVPGDVISVHAGTYRETVNPPRGGLSPENRITYQAAPGERPVIKGSEIVKGWVKSDTPNVWSLRLPHSWFGKHNHPFREQVEGDWLVKNGRNHHTGMIFLNGRSLFEMDTKAKVLKPRPIGSAVYKDDSLKVWFVEQDDEGVTLWINTQGADPNQETTEITTRSTCFYPENEGVNYITLKGFEICQAATQWAAPTAHQIGMVSTHWNKGWIIEDNIIHDSRCNGITLGKEAATGHNPATTQRDKDGSVHYIEVIFNVLRKGWNKQNIGSHLVRNNTIYNCEQTGICGSMGCAFSEVTGNHVYNIWVQRLFAGYEMAGIKFHGAIDTTLSNNHIHQAGRGIWLDWMAQGVYVTGNTLYDNDQDDLYIEVSHGPGLIDNNIMLSRKNIYYHSQGYAFAHNFFGGFLDIRPEPHARFTPYQLNHSTEIMGLDRIKSGDDRYYYNIFAPLQGQKSTGLEALAHYPFPSKICGNLYFAGLKPAPGETEAVETSLKQEDIKRQSDEKGKLLSLTLPWDKAISLKKLLPVTTSLLGKNRMTKCPYELPDGSPIVIDYDFAGNTRKNDSCVPGPLADLPVRTHPLPIRP
ncbi:right-handed parallel beta-helix repeat-containing protein [Akkermansia sp. N21116]|uniref:right-handed parallel beta-helix repeat-containing protein n=1 Tax=Akkermansia sp. N21116 TaxID=3040764 RepID=UPI002AC964B8|nr:right-handed parallel beta-helix repeat-containing protein [Akkermansia sp. N21116]WPX41036.1 right-handed parallel beta-helix repeat-containing protein [Akkermansia sp. N21116]